MGWLTDKTGMAKMIVGVVLVTWYLVIPGVINCDFYCDRSLLAGNWTILISDDLNVNQSWLLMNFHNRVLGESFLVIETDLRIPEQSWHIRWPQSDWSRTINGQIFNFCSFDCEKAYLQILEVHRDADVGSLSDVDFTSKGFYSFITRNRSEIKKL
jgi:hypothetical protein